MNEYRGKHAPSHPWPVASTASVPSRRGRHQKRSRRRRVGFFIVILLVLLMIAYPFIEPKIITVNHQKYSDAKLRLPSNMEYLRVVYVSDIHWGHWFSDWDLDRLAVRINELYPDILVFGGDYAVDFESAVDFFSRLQKYKFNTRLVTCGVLGESDYIGEDVAVSRLTDAMKNAGVIPLVDDKITFPLTIYNETDPQATERFRICIVGADDYLSGSSDLKSLSALSAVSSSDYVIFLSHNPAVITTVQKQTDYWFDLALFGHTHGGQVPVVSDLLEISEEVSEYYMKKAGQLFEESKSHLLLSRGIGTSVIPCRLFCFPEINCIDICPD